jgi:ribonucleoside-diphosphate reductase alpha chain
MTQISPLQEFVFISKYSRWDWEKGRRQTWEETVDRYFEYLAPRVPEKLRFAFESYKKHVLSQAVAPSMRALWSAGAALDKHNVAAYNCAYLAIDSIEAFAETIYILSCGAGVGYSVEKKYIDKLPRIPTILEDRSAVITVADSKEGWSEAYKSLMQALYNGSIPTMDYSKIRPSGTVLKTFGGRSSGPEPFKHLCEFTISTFKKSKGRKLTSVECYDICGYIAQCIVSGGVRRSATISLSDLTDKAMRDSKTGEFWKENSQRSFSNNSVAYDEKPDMETFMQEWISLAKSNSGERGIFSRPAAEKIVKGTKRRETGYDWGCNPCSEIILRPMQFCNLTEVVVRPGDSLTTLCEKVKTAVVLGCLQSTLTDFKNLRPEWKENCEAERLLGVSLTGMRDHEVLNGKSRVRLRDWLKAMKDQAQKTSKKWSKALGINMPAAITCVKPSGSVSKLVNASAGLHDRWSPFQIQRVRSGKGDPITQLMIDQGVPHQQAPESDSLLAFDFPIMAPKGSESVRDSRNAIQQLEYWKDIQQAWCEHKPSCTVYVKEDEWLEVGAWVYKNFDLVSGISFLPHSDSVHPVSPNEEITQEKYEQLVKEFPKLDFSKLTEYEKEDYTQGAREYACVGGNCDIS